jgi:tetratricopeptide (TPR) repeat protein
MGSYLTIEKEVADIGDLMLNKQYATAKEKLAKLLPEERNIINYPGILYYQSEIFWHEGKQKESFEYMDKYLAIGKDTDGNFKKGLLYLCAREYDVAKICFEKALELNPHDDRTMAQMASLYMETSNHDEAIRYIDMAIKNCRSSSSLCNHYTTKTDILDYFGEQQEAMACCNTALGIDPKCVKALRYKAFDLIKLNDYKSALVVVETIQEYENTQEIQDLRSFLLKILK